MAAAVHKSCQPANKATVLLSYSRVSVHLTMVSREREKGLPLVTKAMFGMVPPQIVSRYQGLKVLKVCTFQRPCLRYQNNRGTPILIFKSCGMVFTCNLYTGYIKNLNKLSWGGCSNFDLTALKHQLTNGPLIFMVLILKPAIVLIPHPLTTSSGW